MPYEGGNRLGAEKASKLGHIDVVKSPLVQKLIEEFEHPDEDNTPGEVKDNPIPEDQRSFPFVFAVDGSIQPIDSKYGTTLRQVAFVKTALFRLDQGKLLQLDRTSPHPFALRDIMRDSALFHAVVFPLRNVRLGDKSVYDSVRQIIYEALQDEKLKEISVFETLKWLAYQKWDGKPKPSPDFQCPHCDEEVEGLRYDSDKGPCEKCGKEVYISDMLGFHLEMGEESAPGSVASAYMMVHETLLLFSGIRHLWESGQEDLFDKCLFLKDGPLNLRSQYVKLIDPIRNFLDFAKKEGITIYLCGQEKTGLFVEHLELIGKRIPANHYFLPDNEYIRTHVQQRKANEQYGYRTNYGNKVFLKVGENHQLVVSIPPGKYIDSDTASDLIGFDRITGTLKDLLSFRHENALVPIELAHGVASLSTYPSAHIFRLFSGI
ncbi:hypothetical protein [Ekhidna sp.]|uniref:hypothetical protein n=1 Tax=Ekhidna sp. TaxID=2608089 RepID=UPI003B5B04D0